MNPFDSIAESFFHFAIACFVAGFCLCLFLIFVVPWLWDLVKPWLHSITA